MAEELVKIDLSPVDAERFKLFQKHYPKLIVLIDSGMFDIFPSTMAVTQNYDGVVTGINIIDFPLFRMNKLLTKSLQIIRLRQI